MRQAAFRKAGGAVAAGLAFVLASGAASGAKAQSLSNTALPTPDPRASITLTTDNDAYVAKTDRWYTNGFRLDYTSPEGHLPGIMQSLDNKLAGLFGPAVSSWSMGLGQNMYTPENTKTSNPDPHDRPYAGYLYAYAGLNRRTNTTLDSFQAAVGVVGPSSLARATQDVVHNLIGDHDAHGWHYQLKDEPVFNLNYQRIWRVPVWGNQVDGLGVDILPAASVALGTVQIYAGAGGRIRFGRNLAADFGPARIAPSLGDAPAPRGPGWGWYVFGGAGGRAVAHDMLIEGNNFRDSRGVDIRPFVADLEGGAAVFWGNIRLSMTLDYRTKEFVAQRVNDKFGSISLTYSF